MAQQAPDQVWTLLEDARQRIDANDLEAAKELIDAALLVAENDPTAYSDAISTLMLGRLYDEAERVHLRYTESTGLRLRADFTLEEIRDERAASQPKRDGATVTYRRLTLRQRGHFSNHFTLFPVTQLAIAPSGLTIWRRRRSWQYAWPDVRVTIQQRRAIKGFGRSSFAHYAQRLCVIEAHGRRFIFDLSDQYPDFHPPREVIALLATYCEIHGCNPV